MKRGAWVRWRAWLVMGLVWVALGGLASPVSAQEGPGGEEEEHPKGPPPKEFLKKMQVMRSLKAAEVLELDEATGQKLGAALAQHDERILKSRQALREAEKKLRQGLKGGASDAQLQAWVEEVIASKQALDEAQIQQFRQAGAVLDTKGRATLLLFLPRFDKEVRRVLSKERERRRGERGERGERRKERRERREGRGGRPEGSPERPPDDPW